MTNGDVPGGRFVHIKMDHHWAYWLAMRLLRVACAPGVAELLREYPSRRIKAIIHVVVELRDE